MNGNEPFDLNLDRLLTDWLEADAAPRAPESLETAFVEAVARTRQRPAWATTERWISMETRAQLGVMPRVVIVLHYYLGLPMHETAQALGLPVGTVKSRLNRTKTQMRASLEADARLPLQEGGPA